MQGTWWHFSKTVYWLTWETIFSYTKVLSASDVGSHPVNSGSRLPNRYFPPSDSFHVWRSGKIPVIVIQIQVLLLLGQKMITKIGSLLPPQKGFKSHRCHSGTASQSQKLQRYGLRISGDMVNGNPCQKYLDDTHWVLWAQTWWYFPRYPPFCFGLTLFLIYNIYDIYILIKRLQWGLHFFMIRCNLGIHNDWFGRSNLKYSDWLGPIMWC